VIQTRFLNKYLTAPHPDAHFVCFSFDEFNLEDND